MRLTDINTFVPSLRGFWYNINLVRNFDSKWYVEAYPDAAVHRLSPLMHFVRYGIPEKRRPSAWFDPMQCVEEPTCSTPKHNRFSRKFFDIRTHDPAYLDALRVSQELLVFFNVTTKNLSGGMLSIDRFVDLAIEMTNDQPGAEVVVSGVPLIKAPEQYTLFESRLPMTHFAWLVRNTNPKKVRLFVPEVFTKDCIRDLNENETYRFWLKGRVDLEINIMNQNLDLMPKPGEFLEQAWELTKNVQITTAHQRYCTASLATDYGLPVKQLTPILPKLVLRKAKDRDRIFMLSPDLFEDPASGLTHDTVIDRLKELFPDFRFVVVNKMKLLDYLDLASRAMFSLTFGEGMDGYFIEPVLSKGVSFAVYNDVFFPKQFADAPTVARDWPSLLKLIEELVPQYLADSDFYDETSETLQALMAQIYSREVSRCDFKDLLDGKVDHVPVAQISRLELFDNLRVFFENERGFRFHNGAPGDKQVVVTPDGLLVEHLGSEFYSVLYEIYERRDYDLPLDPAQEYVLVDIGANVGMASLYLSRSYPNIREVFAYEPVHSVAKVARLNFKANKGLAPVHLKEIGLSDTFDTRTLEFFDDWSTAFSTDNVQLNSFLKHDEHGSRLEPRKIEIEVVPASAEFEAILQVIGERRVVLKCDSQGSEFAVFRSLDQKYLLDRVDAVVLESHFFPPDAIIEILTRNGFYVDVRCDHEENVVYTIKANRKKSA